MKSLYKLKLNSPSIVRKLDTNEGQVLVSRCVLPAGKVRKYWFRFFNFKDKFWCDYVRECKFEKKYLKKYCFSKCFPSTKQNNKKISKQKYNDSLSLFFFLTSECRNFYKGLRHSNPGRHSGNPDYPVDNASDEKWFCDSESLSLIHI